MSRTLIPTTLFLVVSLAGVGSANDSVPIQLPGGSTLEEVDFDRHVVPLLSRFGCNAGSCHGSFQGRGGMRFSLFGHSAKMDYEELLERIDTEEAADSLALLKPTNEYDHEGGERFKKDSWAYQVMHRWIATGAQRSARESESPELSIEPKLVDFASTEESRRIRVQADFGEAKKIDVTPFCRFTSGDEGLVTVDDDGLVKAIRPGAAHITVEYRGNFATVLTTSKLDSAPAPIQIVPPANFVDDFIDARLAQLRVTTSPPASDEQFLRRVTIDTVARLPTTEEMETFRQNTSPDRRRQLIDGLLNHDRHASLWATRLCDMTRCTSDLMESPDELKPKRAKMWHDWFRVRFAENAPYDKIVRGVLCGTSADDQGYAAWLADEARLVRGLKDGFDHDYHKREFLDLYWRRRTRAGLFPRRELAEVTSAAFLGIQIECAQCHKHPYDRWTQAEYRGFVNIFSRVQFGTSTDLNALILEHLQARREIPIEERPPSLPKIAEVYNAPELARPLSHPSTNQIIPPTALGERGGVALTDSSDPREQLANWMLSEGRQQFARNFVNRVWAQYFGRGIVEPVDGFTAMNPASHPELLDRLATEFIDSNYDVRKLETLLLTSNAYGRSSAFAGNNAEDRRHFARAYVRPLMAEAAIDILHQAMGIPFDAADSLPKGSTAIEFGGDQFPGNSVAAKMMSTFGRQKRDSACDCDREREPSLRQALFQMSDPWIMQSIAEGELMKSLLAAEDSFDATRLAFRHVLGREPTMDDLLNAKQHVKSADNAKQAWTDIVWALINTREFLTNR